MTAFNSFPIKWAPNMFAYILPTEPQNSKSPFSFVIKVENK